MKLLVIGELAAQLLDEHAAVVGNYPEIPWHQRKECVTGWRTATLYWILMLSGKPFKSPSLI